MMWRGDCVHCGQTDKLGWSHSWAKGFWCQACHDHLDGDEEMPPAAPPRWDGGDWGVEPTTADIEQYIENGGLLEQSFQIDDEAITVVSDPQRYLFKGIGGSIWNASIELASFMRGISSTLPADAVVLELGAGCGIPGLHFARTNPQARVVSTDVPHLLALLRHNARGISNVSVAPLTWGLEEDIKPWLSQRLDVVIAADVVFDLDYHDAFLETLRTLSRGTAAEPRVPPARIILAMAMRMQEVEDFRAATRRHNMELTQLVMRPGRNSWASAVGIYDCVFQPASPRKRSFSDASTACSTPTACAPALMPEIPEDLIPEPLKL